MDPKTEDTSQENNPKPEISTQVEDLKNALARALADLANFKRRTEEEKAKFIQYAYGEVLMQLIPVIDNFDRSAKHLPEDIKGNEWVKGVIQIHDDFLKTLDKLGVKKIETVGKKVDAKFHEPLLSGPGEKDIITEEFEAGYLLGNEVLKPAKVKVGDGSKK